MTLGEKGQGDDEIAAAFFVTPQVVKQRLKLASVSPALLEIYAEDEMTLEQLMAFTVNPDHERQVQVWDANRSTWDKEPYQIRRMLTETSVRASERRAILVVVEATRRRVAPFCTTSSSATTAAGWKILPRLIAGSARSFRLKSKRLRPKVGNGSRSRSTCPMAKATVCGG